MIPKVSRGDRMGGLLSYLAGPGSRNEHRDPHLVAADESVLQSRFGGVLDRSRALQLARVVDEPRRLYGRQVPGGSVWHCSLSLSVDERPVVDGAPNQGGLSDEQWGEIATGFVRKMGFDGSDGQAPCRWVAVHHGRSARGNDHIHIVVSLTREDGEPADVWRDYVRAQQAAGELEREHGLQVLASRELGRGSRAYTHAEQERADRRGDPEPATPALARTVRACAAASADEAEFVRRMRDADLLVRPRFARGGEDTIVGYSVATRPGPGEQAIWYGGGRLARDLTITRLRAGWPQDATAAAAAGDEWRAAHHRQPVVARGRESRTPTPQDWDRHTRELADLREQLRGVPADDHATWSHVAGVAAGVLAAWSHRVERRPGPLAAAADSIARSGQLRARRVNGTRPVRRTSSGGPGWLAAAAGASRAARLQLLTTLLGLSRALYDAHRATADLRRAREIERAVRGELAKVAGALTPADVQATGTTSPQPGLQPAPRRQPGARPGTGPDRGVGR